MTDQPETEAGRALLEWGWPTPLGGRARARDAIRRIEAEARASERQRVEALEAALADLLSVIGIIALPDIDYPPRSPEGKVRRARALLASPTPEPRPALRARVKLVEGPIADVGAHPGKSHQWREMLHYGKRGTGFAECICGAVGVVEAQGIRLAEPEGATR